ncbi:MAG TPA: DUF362 domain-containing protein [Patescibacteria group bacterium]|nr:DUF362 domain-containing protein [Patescibacteria group bacterium]
MEFGDVTLSRVNTSDDLKSLLPDWILGAETVIVKPNWFSPHPANFTNSESLGILLEALDAKVVVVEAYTLEKHDGSMSFKVDGENVDWMWIMKHPDWGWAKEEGRWDEIRRQDRWFLEEHGFTDLFDEHGVEYVNVTEEVWQGRIADPVAIKRNVESVYRPAFTEEIYGFVPERLHDLWGAPMISYGKVKGIGGYFPSLTVKNMFGLIPDPLRSWWHGPNDSRLSPSIVDMTKVYASLFRLFGICEAIKNVTISRPDGEVKVPWGSYDIVRDLGVVVLGPDLVSLDAVICGLIGVDPEKVSYIELGEEAFGEYDRSLVERAVEASKDWFPR